MYNDNNLFHCFCLFVAFLSTVSAKLLIFQQDSLLPQATLKNVQGRTELIISLWPVMLSLKISEVLRVEPKQCFCKLQLVIS